MPRAKKKTLIVTCNRDWCDFEEVHKVDVVPSRMWHEYNELGKIEQHLCNIELEET